MEAKAMHIRWSKGMHLATLAQQEKELEDPFDYVAVGVYANLSTTKGKSIRHSLGSLTTWESPDSCQPSISPASRGALKG